MANRTIEAPEGVLVPIWDKHDLEASFEQLKSAEPYDAHPHDIHVTRVNMDGFYFNIGLYYISPHKINYRTAYMPYPERTFFRFGHQNGRPHILETALGYWLHRYDLGENANGGDLSTRLVYKLTFNDRKSVAGMLITDKNGHVKQEKPFVEGKDGLILPGDPEFLAQTRGMFMRSEYMVG